ncbi:MAG: F420-dependent methylenetetrahydromethanopterin dehydrogenase [Candidatus Bathyarchaeota archaeon]|nr:F420-dependent methylenetetrahydromethanopterin dehydrogenase [Candidatus Bathyarchaeota archaeon]
MVTITFVKIGYIATTTLIDALLDERSARTDIKMRVISSSVKMDAEEAEEVAKIAAGIESDLYIAISPNISMPGPRKLREILKETGKPIIAIGDEPSRKEARKLPEEGMGYIVIYGDPMISAKTAYLDAVEMALFNADAIRVLAVTGAFRLIHKTLDKVIDQIKAGEKPELPELVITKKRALAASDIQNPYAYAKAMAAYEAARGVAKLSTEGVFKTEDREEALPILGAAHELMRHAAKLADEAREIEKSNDTAVRLTHFKKGDRRKKTGLRDKYQK